MSKITIARIYWVPDGSALVTDMTNVSPANGGAIQVEAITDFDVPSDGESRYIVIDSEQIAYTDVDEATDELLNITRAANSTVAAAHTPGTFVQAGLTERREKFADGFVDDDDSLAQGVEILRHLWRFYPTGDRDNDEMEIASVRYLDDGSPIIVDAPETSENEDLGSPTVVPWSKLGALTTGVREHQFPAPFGGQIEEARLTLGENGAASGASVIADILVNGVSILTTKLTIAAGATISDAVEPTTKEITKGDLVQIEFEQIGSTDSGWDPTLYLTVWPTVDAMVGRIEVEGPQGETGAAGTDGLITEVRWEGTPVDDDAPVLDLIGSGIVDASSDGSVLTVEVASGAAGDVARKAANEQVLNSTTLQDDDHVVWSLEASKTYVIFGALGIFGGTTGDIKLTFTGPTGCLIDFHMIGPAMALGATAVESDARFGQQTQGNTLSFGTSQSGPPGNVTIFVFAIVRMDTTAGDVKLRWAQNALDAAAATFILNGSGLVVMEVN